MATEADAGPEEKIIDCIDAETLGLE